MSKLIQEQPALAKIKEERCRLVRLTVIWILSFVVMAVTFILTFKPELFQVDMVPGVSKVLFILFCVFAICFDVIGVLWLLQFTKGKSEGVRISVALVLVVWYALIAIVIWSQISLPIMEGTREKTGAVETKVQSTTGLYDKNGQLREDALLDAEPVVPDKPSVDHDPFKDKYWIERQEVTKDGESNEDTAK